MEANQELTNAGLSELRIRELFIDRHTSAPPLPVPYDPFVPSVPSVPQVNFRRVKSYLNPNREATSLTSDEKEFQMVERHFMKMSQSLCHVIMSIDFVNNPTLQMKFDEKKLSFKKANIPDEEVFAYHGTNHYNIQSICQNNLNVISRAAHGNGYYFSEFPDISVSYGENELGLILFKTLPGHVYVGKDKNQHTGADAKYQSKKIPPGEVNDSRGFHLIIENNEQFIPYCVIHLAEKQLMENLKANPDLMAAYLKQVCVVCNLIICYLWKGNPK